MPEKLVDVELDGIKTETEKAWLVVVGKTEAWVPKSQVTYDQQDSVMTMPEWLAMEKGLV